MLKHRGDTAGVSKGYRSVITTENSVDYTHTLYYERKHESFNAGMKSLNAKLPAEIFSGDVNF
jgi:hypothetical protein